MLYVCVCASFGRQRYMCRVDVCREMVVRSKSSTVLLKIRSGIYGGVVFSCRCQWKWEVEVEAA